jgi:purine-binding chemotaxis protein CheW
MTSRKKPQQQLACYFDELLTELDEDIIKPTAEPISDTTKKAPALAEPRTSKVAVPKVAVSKIAAPKVAAPKVAPVESTTTRTTKPINPPASKVVSQSAPDSVSQTAHSTNPVSAPKKPLQAPVNHDASTSTSTHTSTSVSSSDTGLMPKPTVHKQSASPSSQPLADVDLRQREKDKLERLLKTLTPTVESQLIQSAPKVDVKPQPVETAQPTKSVETIDVKTKPVAAPTVPKIKVDQDISLNQTTAVDVKVDVAVEAETETGSDINGLAAPIDMMSTSPHRWEPLGHEWQENGRPAWAENSFDVLLVEVNGVKLALPLEALDGIYPLENDLTPLFGQAKWFMGLQKTITGNVSIINTAQFVMPERYDKEHISEIKYSVAINGSGWGLAVDSIHQPVPVNPDDIRWRVRRSERPWMAGTVKDHMCALLDIPYLAHSLKTQDRNRQAPND